MRSFSLLALGAPLLALAQTPPNSSPSTSNPLSLTYGSTTVSPAGELLSQALVDSVTPVVSSSNKYTGKYTFALVDLKIPWSVVDTDHPETLVPGIGVNRTTRLHWWLDNVTQNSKGVLNSTTTAIADYEGPQPPPNDEPHSYVLYLFNQPAEYTPPYGSEARAQAFFDASTYNGDDRMNFSVTDLAAILGNPIAATYFDCQNAGNTS